MQRPYPYHLDYYKMRFGGSYAPYFGNLYGPSPLVVGAAPYGYGYGGGYGYGYNAAPPVVYAEQPPVQPLTCPHCGQPIYLNEPPAATPAPTE